MRDGSGAVAVRRRSGWLNRVGADILKMMNCETRYRMGPGHQMSSSGQAKLPRKLSGELRTARTRPSAPAIGRLAQIQRHEQRGYEYAGAGHPAGNDCEFRRCCARGRAHSGIWATRPIVGGCLLKRLPGPDSPDIDYRGSNRRVNRSQVGLCGRKIGRRPGNPGYSRVIPRNEFQEFLAGGHSKGRMQKGAKSGHGASPSCWGIAPCFPPLRWHTPAQR
jgi:hypothetical protein